MFSLLRIAVLTMSDLWSCDHQTLSPEVWCLKRKKLSEVRLARGRRENAEVWCWGSYGCICREIQWEEATGDTDELCQRVTLIRTGPLRVQSETIHRLDYLIGSFTDTHVYCYTGIRQVILKSLTPLQPNLYVSLDNVIHIAGRLLNEWSGVRIPAGARSLFCPKYYRPALEPTRPPVQCILAFFPAIRPLWLDLPLRR